MLAHNLLFAIVAMSIAAMISTKRVALLAFVAVHLDCGDASRRFLRGSASCRD